MDFIELMKKRDKKIEELSDTLFNLKHGLEGAEVEYQGKEAMVMDVNWEEKQVLLNYDDVNMEWISFGE